jgi:hypothetical protein
MEQPEINEIMLNAQYEIIKKLLAIPCSDDDKAKVIREIVLTLNKISC